MAQIHDIDGTALSYISSAPWAQPVNSESLNLIAVHNRWRRHTWNSNVMTTAEWATLIGKRGSVVSITTTDPDDPNGDYVTYFGVYVRNITFSSHDSLNIRGAKIEFLLST